AEMLFDIVTKAVLGRLESSMSRPIDLLSSFLHYVVVGEKFFGFLLLSSLLLPNSLGVSWFVFLNLGNFC
ncbi:MAG: hypothetical protein ACKO96_19025, partial [Flammeovirgaceae bacterium]